MKSSGPGIWASGGPEIRRVRLSDRSSRDQNLGRLLPRPEKRLPEQCEKTSNIRRKRRYQAQQGLKPHVIWRHFRQGRKTSPEAEQGLKPRQLGAPVGTTKVVPCYKTRTVFHEISRAKGPAQTRLKSCPVTKRDSKRVVPTCEGVHQRLVTTLYWLSLVKPCVCRLGCVFHVKAH